MDYHTIMKVNYVLRDYLQHIRPEIIKMSPIIRECEGKVLM